MTFVGIDVSRKTLDVAALYAAGEIRYQQFNNTQAGHIELGAWLKGLSDCRIVLEATGSYHERLAQALTATGAYFSVVNPAQTSYSVRSRHRRSKTDKADASCLPSTPKSVNLLLTNPLPQSIARINTL